MLLYVTTTWSIFGFLLMEDNLFQQLMKEDFRMLHEVTTGAYYPHVDTTWKILTTGASQLTAGALCTGGKVTVVDSQCLWDIF